MKTIKIFGYGSLINEKSLRKTVPYAFNLFPAKIKGFVRVFNLRAKRRICPIKNIPVAMLNIEKSEFNEEVNGICSEINLEHLDELKQREILYELIKVEIEDYKGNLHKGYTFRALHHDAYDFIFDSSEQMDYVNICLQGAKAIGEDFLEEFKKTTFIGDKTLDLIDNI